MGLHHFPQVGVSSPLLPAVLPVRQRRHEVDGSLRLVFPTRPLHTPQPVNTGAALTGKTDSLPQPRANLLAGKDEVVQAERLSGPKDGLTDLWSERDLECTACIQRQMIL